MSECEECGEPAESGLFCTDNSEWLCASCEKDARTCDGCGTEQADYERIWPTDDGRFCTDCMEDEQGRIQEEAEEFAEETCEITAPLRRFDPSRREKGYTEYMVACHNAHNCTNYENLIRNLRRDSPRDQIYYLAIKGRITDLIEEAGPEMYEKDVGNVSPAVAGEAGSRNVVKSPAAD